MEEVEAEFKDDCVFVPDYIEAIVKFAINEVLKEKPYNEKMIQNDTNLILQTIIHRVMEREKPFKYIINIVITPKYGSGVKTGSMSYWDLEKDTLLTVRWENNHLLCIVCFWAIAFFQTTVPVLDNIVGKFRREGGELIPLSKSKHSKTQETST